MEGWYETYQTIWFVFYGLAALATLSLAASSIRSSGSRFLTIAFTVLLAVLVLGYGPMILALPIVIAGISIGLAGSSRNRFLRNMLIIGIFAVAVDSLWPSKLPVGSGLTTNRPTLARLAIGIARGDQYFRGGTMYAGDSTSIEQEVTLFGKYPIRVGEVGKMGAPRFELQVLFTLLAFYATFLITRMLFRRKGDFDGRDRPLLISLIAVFVAFFPIHGLTPLTILAGFVLGRQVPVARGNQSTGRKLFMVSALLILYHASFVSTLIEGFGSGETTWESFNAAAALIALALGHITTAAPESAFRRGA